MNNDDDGENRQPLLEVEPTNGASTKHQDREDQRKSSLTRRVWIETKKLWHVVGPIAFQRVVTYSMFMVTQAFAGHLGEVEQASVSIANIAICVLCFGLFVSTFFLLELYIILFFVSFLQLGLSHIGFFFFFN